MDRGTVSDGSDMRLGQEKDRLMIRIVEIGLAQKGRTKKRMRKVG